MPQSPSFKFQTKHIYENNVLYSNCFIVFYLSFISFCFFFLFLLTVEVWTKKKKKNLQQKTASRYQLKEPPKRKTRSIFALFLYPIFCIYFFPGKEGIIIYKYRNKWERSQVCKVTNNQLPNSKITTSTDVKSEESTRIYSLKNLIK